MLTKALKNMSGTEVLLTKPIRVGMALKIWGSVGVLLMAGFFSTELHEALETEGSFWMDPWPLLVCLLGLALVYGVIFRIPFTYLDQDGVTQALPWSGKIVFEGSWTNLSAVEASYAKGGVSGCVLVWPGSVRIYVGDRMRPDDLAWQLILAHVEAAKIEPKLFKVEAARQRPGRDFLKLLLAAVGLMAGVVLLAILMGGVEGWLAN